MPPAVDLLRVRGYIYVIMENADISFVELTTPESLAVVRDIAAEIWPETFRTILPPEQIPYMMKMMYSPEVMEEELAAGFHFDALYVDEITADERILPILARKGVQVTNGNIKDESEAANETV